SGSRAPRRMVGNYPWGWIHGLLGPGVCVHTKIIARVFSPDPAVVRVGATLLLVAAAFQLFDGVQVVTTGALRGAGDTKTPMLANLGSYWFIGIPLGYFLCFRLGWGALGVWIGLCIGLMIIGSALLFVWRKKV